ncbi:hypothetical protein LCGC14_2613890, partial [marine sediment metagenome]
HQNNVRYRNFILERIDLLRKNDILTFWTDARNYHEVSKRVRQFEPDVVIHLAAIAHANKANKSPFQTFDHSLRTLENTLDASLYPSVKQVIYFSSSMVYGEFGGKEVTEETPLKPKGIYGALKVSGELLVKAYSEVKGTNYTIIRPSALYGPRCVSRRVIQIFIENALAGKDLTIQGDGEEKLDFTYIDDLVQGVCSMIGNEKAYNETFNITYGDSRSIKETSSVIIKTLVKHFKDYRGFTKYEKRDKLMPIRGTLSVDKAKSLLGYKPEYPIEKGIKKYLEWYQNEKSINIDD